MKRDNLRPACYILAQIGRKKVIFRPGARPGRRGKIPLFCMRAGFIAKASPPQVSEAGLDGGEAAQISGVLSFSSGASSTLLMAQRAMFITVFWAPTAMMT